MPPVCQQVAIYVFAVLWYQYGLELVLERPSAILQMWSASAVPNHCFVFWIIRFPSLRCSGSYYLYNVKNIIRVPAKDRYTNSLQYPSVCLLSQRPGVYTSAFPRDWYISVFPLLAESGLAMWKNIPECATGIQSVLGFPKLVVLPPVRVQRVSWFFFMVVQVVWHRRQPVIS